MSTSQGPSSTARSSGPQSGIPTSAVEEEDMDEGELSLDDLTDSSLASPVATTAQASETRKRKTGKGKGKGRKTRISSACLECKKRRRKCTGENPCQTCVDFQTECVYDPAMDRRSKAYFHKRLADGLAGVVDSKKSQDESLSVIREKADTKPDLATEAQTLPRRERSSTFAPIQDSDVAAAGSPGDRLVCPTFCGLSTSGSSAAMWYPAKLQHQQELRLRGPEHLITPHVIPDQSPLSLMFENFKNGVSNMLAQGTPLSQVLGDLDPVVDLIFRPRQPTDPFSAPTWACELARIDINVDIFTQLANAVLLSRFMRWQLAPSLENYLLLPEMMRPTLAQKTIPHFAPADLFSIPAVRDCLISGKFELQEPIGRPGVQGIRFHWPFDMDKAVHLHPMTSVRVISRLFSACASEPSNWSCSKDFFVNSPMTRGLLNVIDHRHEWTALSASGPAE